MLFFIFLALAPLQSMFAKIPNDQRFQIVINKSTAPLKVDGKLDELVWQNSPIGLAYSYAY